MLASKTGGLHEEQISGILARGQGAPADPTDMAQLKGALNAGEHADGRYTHEHRAIVLSTL